MDFWVVRCNLLVEKDWYIGYEFGEGERRDLVIY